MAQTLKQKVLSGMVWSGLGQGWSYVVNFTISLILARILAPEEFGIVAIVGVFIAIFGVFIDSGFSMALIQKKDLHPADCSSVFFLNLSIGIFLYIGLFVFAPWIADFYHESILVPCIRVSALTIIISSLSLVQGAMIYRAMLFQINFRISVISLFVSGIVGVAMAFKGFGVWALVTQTVLRSLISSSCLWFWGIWRPIWVIDFKRLKSLFQFGSKLFFSGILDCVCNNVYPMIFGRLFDFSTLAYYNRGERVPSLSMGIINGTIGSVLFPTLAGIQDNPERMHQVVKTFWTTIMFLVIPAMTLLFVVSEPLTIILFKDKWLPAVPYMQIFCFIFMLYPFHTLNLTVLNACGRSDIFLLLEIIKKVQLIIIVLITFRFGPMAMVYGTAVGAVLGIIENSWMSRKLIGYGIEKQLKDILLYLLLSMCAGGGAWFIYYACFSSIWLKLAVPSIVFCGLYFSLALTFQIIPEDIVRILAEKLNLNVSKKA
jgi:polysaccharide biosynthesis protein